MKLRHPHHIRRHHPQPPIRPPTHHLRAGQNSTFVGREPRWLGTRPQGVHQLSWNWVAAPPAELPAASAHRIRRGRQNIGPAEPPRHTDGSVMVTSINRAVEQGAPTHKPTAQSTLAIRPTVAPAGGSASTAAVEAALLLLMSPPPLPPPPPLASPPSASAVGGRALTRPPRSSVVRQSSGTTPRPTRIHPLEGGHRRRAPPPESRAVSAAKAPSRPAPLPPRECPNDAVSCATSGTRESGTSSLQRSGRQWPRRRARATAATVVAVAGKSADTSHRCAWAILIERPPDLAGGSLSRGSPTRVRPRLPRGEAAAAMSAPLRRWATRPTGTERQATAAPRLCGCHRHGVVEKEADRCASARHRRRDRRRRWRCRHHPPQVARHPRGSYHPHRCQPRRCWICYHSKGQGVGAAIGRRGSRPTSRRPARAVIATTEKILLQQTRGVRRKPHVH